MTVDNWQGVSPVVLPPKSAVLPSEEKGQKEEKKGQQEKSNAYYSTLLGPQAEACGPWSLPDLTGGEQVDSTDGEMHTTHLQLSTSRSKLSSVAQSFGMTCIAAVVQAAFGVVVSEYVEQQATLIETKLLKARSETEDKDYQATIPYCINRTGSNRETLQSIADQWHLSPQHRRVDPRVLREALSWPAEQPLYPAIFNIHSSSGKEGNVVVEEETQQTTSTACRDNVLSIESPPQQQEHAFVLDFFDGNKLSITLSVSIQVMSSAHTAMFAQQVDAHLSAMIDHLDVNSSTLSNHISSSLLSICQPSIPRQVKEATRIHPYHWVQYYSEHEPDWVAAEQVHEDYTSQQWTYKQLHCRSSQYANLIRQLIPNTSSVVALCMDRTLEAFAVILAIFQTGHIYLPIAEDLPDDRKKTLLSDSEAKLVFASEGLTAPFEEIDALLLVTDSSKVSSTLESMSETYILNSTSEAGYLLYTSGSTGKPKGVRVTNGNLSAYIEGYANIILTQSEKVSQLGGRGKQMNLASRAFDPHISQMFLSWRFGFCATTGPRPMLLEDLPRAVNQLGITHLGSLPSVLDQNGLTPGDVPSLAVLAVGGEKITKHVLDTWATSKDVSVFNLYGPTETTIGCTLNIINSNSGPKNIGYPLGNSTALVVQPGTLNVIKLGQTGELCIAGDLVTKGYLRPQQNSGFCTLVDGTPAYRTGDMVQMLLDRSIEFLGRKDEQVKIRGQRLELSEVNECVLSTPLSVPISSTTVYTKHPQLPTSRLFTFVSIKKENTGDSGGQTSMEFLQGGETSQTIMEHCQRQLPSFMIPTLLFVDSIPLLPSGKVNTKQAIATFSSTPFSEALKTTSDSNTNSSSSARALNEEEKKIVEAIKSVLDCQDFSITLHNQVSIYELGIDSLNAVKLSLEMKKLGYTASVASILQNDTLSKLACLPRKSVSEPIVESVFDLKTFEKENRNYIAKSSNRLQLPISSIETILPAMPLQQALVALTIAQVQATGKSPYVHHTSFQVKKTIGIEELASAWSKMISREDILRTCFVEGHDGYIVQVVLKRNQVTSQVEVRNTNVDEKDVSSIWKSWQAEVDYEIVTNIASVAPYRILLLNQKVLDKPPLMFIAMHHSVYDGESFSFLLDDLSRLVQDQDVPLRPRSIALLESIAEQDESQAHDFWANYLKGFRPVSIVEVDKKEEEASKVSDSLHFDVSSSFYPLLKTRAAQLKTTLPILCQAAFALILAKKSNQRDIVFGNVMSGRSVLVEGVDRMLMPCLTTMPLRVNMQTLLDLEEVVQETKASSTSIWPFQHSSLTKVQRWSDCEEALFDVLFTFRFVDSKVQEEKEKVFENIDSKFGTNYPLSVDIKVDGGKETIQVSIGYSTSSIGKENAQSMGEQMLSLLAQFAQGEKVSLDDLGIIGDDAANKSRKSETQMESEWDEDTPWQEGEEQIRLALAKTLGIQNREEITRGKTFYLLGLDSILAIRFTRFLREEAGLKVHTAQVLQSRCIGALWKSVLLNKQGNQGKEEGEREKKNEENHLNEYRHLFTPLNDDDSLEDMYPCTPLQSGMLSQTMANTDSSYDQAHRIKLREYVDLNRFKRAWEIVVAECDILRTCFHLTNDLQYPWLAIVHSNPILQWHDENSSSSNNNTKVDGNSLTLPPVQVSIDNRNVTFRIHHALYDGVSLLMIFAKLRDTYHRLHDIQLSTITSSSIPPFSNAARYIVKSQRRSNEFWIRTLKDYVYAPLPFAESCVGNHNRVARWRTESQLSMGTRLLEEKCQAMELTMQSVALLAFAKTLSLVLQQRDIVFGQVISGRSLPLEGATEITGPMFNTIPFRVKLASGLESNIEAGKKLQKLSELAHDHQTVSLRQVQSEWRKKGGSASRILDCLFVFHREGQVPDQSEVLWDAVRENSSSDQDEEYDFNFSMVRRKETTSISMNASSRIVQDSKGLEKIATLFNDTLNDIIDRPSCPTLAHPPGLDQIPMTSASHQKSANLLPKKSRPCVGTEVTLKSEFCKLMDVPEEQVDTSTNLLVAGIDSISAIRLARNTMTMGAKITVANIIQGQTIEEICRLAAAAAATAVEATDPSDENRIPLVSDEQVKVALSKLQMKKEDIQDILPCLAGQQHHLDLWYASGGRFLEAPWIYRANNVGVPRLKRAWDSLRRRHDILRTCFVAVDQRSTLQVVMKAESMEEIWEHQVVSAGKSLEEQTRLWILETSASHSNLFTPPLRFILLTNDKESIVVFRLHHALYDAHSIPKLLNDLEALYYHQESDIVSVSSPFPQFTSFVRHTLESRDVEGERRRWETALAGAQNTVVTTLKHGNTGNGETAYGPQIFVRISDAIKDTIGLEKQCRQKGTSLPLVVMLAFARLLASSTMAKKKPMFGLYTASRTCPSFHNLTEMVGPSMNVLPVAISLEDEGGPSASLAKLRNESSARIDYEQSFLYDITTWLNGGHEPLFNCFLNILWHEDAVSSPITPSSSSDDDVGDGESEKKKLSLEPWKLSKETNYYRTQPASPPDHVTSLSSLDTTYLAKNNVYVDVSRQKGGRLHLGIRCSALEFDEEWATRFGHQFVKEINTIVDELV